jgi:hypothetical protein
MLWQACTIYVSHSLGFLGILCGDDILHHFFVEDTVFVELLKLVLIFFWSILGLVFMNVCASLASLGEEFWVLLLPMPFNGMFDRSMRRMRSLMS